jgi:uncharacterized protein YbjT (DUF2867 family)
LTRHTALLAGASGLVGGECLRALLAESRYERVVVLNRRDLGPPVHGGKVEQIVIDFAGLDAVADALRADHVFCALGTTIRKAGSQEKFREVDQHYPRRLAEIVLRNGARHFSVVSALGAHPAAPFFYSRVKGDMEESLRRMGWPSLAIFRPSLIGGQRNESRPLERLSEQLLRFAPKTWRPVGAADIAAAMVATALRSPAGVTVVESRNISAASRSNGP